MNIPRHPRDRRVQGSRIRACTACPDRAATRGRIKILQANEKVRLRVEAKRKGHPLSTLRRVAKVLHARVRVSFEREKKAAGTRVAESGARYGRSATKGVKKAS